MKTHQIIFLSFLIFSQFLFCTLNSIAQDVNELVAQESNLVALKKIGTSQFASVMTFDNRYEGIKGTPYVFEKYESGKIILKSDKVLNNGFEVNINAVDGKAWALVDSSQEIQIDNVYIKSITVNDNQKKRTFIPYKVSMVEGNSNKSEILYEQLYADKNYQFLKKHSRNLKKADYTRAFAPDIRYDEYIKREEYYLLANNKWSKVKIKKGAISKILPGLSKLPEWKGTRLTEDKFVELISKL